MLPLLACSVQVLKACQFLSQDTCSFEHPATSPFPIPASTPVTPPYPTLPYPCLTKPPPVIVDILCRYVTEGMFRASHRKEYSSPPQGHPRARATMPGEPFHSYTRADAEAIPQGAAVLCRFQMLPTAYTFAQVTCLLRLLLSSVHADVQHSSSSQPDSVTTMLKSFLPPLFTQMHCIWPSCSSVKQLWAQPSRAAAAAQTACVCINTGGAVHGLVALCKVVLMAELWYCVACALFVMLADSTCALLLQV